MGKRLYNNRHIIIETTDELIIPNTGIGLAGKILAETNFSHRMDRLTAPGTNEKNTNSDCAKAYLGLLLQGTNTFEDLDSHDLNPSYPYLLQASSVPSKERLRQRFDLLGKMAVKPIILDTIVQTIQSTNARIPILEGVHLKESRMVDGQLVKEKRYLKLSKPIIPVDLDVSPFDNSGSKKEGVSRTYKGMDGYAPNFLYLSTEGYLMNVDLRKGSDHVQKGTPKFLAEGLRRSKEITSAPLCLRMDAGNDSLENCQICAQNDVDYLIKRNLRREDPNAYYELVKQRDINPLKVREGKVYYDFFREIKRSDGQTYRQATRLTVKEIDSTGQLLMFPDVEVESYWTTLDEPVETIIALYHNHAICEQFHSEIKSDLDSERLPSGKFETNQLVLHMIALAYNILRIMGQQYLDYSNAHGRKRPVARLRMKSILKHIMYIASKVVTTARRTVLKISRYTEELGAFQFLNKNLLRE